jgi:SPP1 family predicted phage head-tail adaptor
MRMGSNHASAGEFRNRVEVQSATITLNDAREPIPTWKTFARRWASVVPAESSTEWVRGQLRSTTTYTVRLRHDPTTASITTKHRVRFGGRELQIVGVVNLAERNRIVRLTCSENITEPDDD